MPANIKINNVKSIRFRCNYDKYYDFMLYKGECYGDGSFGDCLAADITPYSLADDGKLYSKAVWGDNTKISKIMEGLINPFGKIIPQPFILEPNYNNIIRMRNQINWLRETAYWFLIIENDYSTYWEYENFANLLSLKIQKFIHG